MANPRITVSDLAEAQQALAEIDDRLSVEKLRLVLADAIDLVRQEAARNVQANIKRDSGALLASLINKPGKNPDRATAWTQAGGKIAPHARLVEYGHRIVSHDGKDTGNRVPPHPFFRPRTPDFRMRLQTNYDLAQVRLREHEIDVKRPPGVVDRRSLPPRARFNWATMAGVLPNAFATRNGAEAKILQASANDAPGMRWFSQGHGWQLLIAAQTDPQHRRPKPWRGHGLSYEDCSLFWA